MDWLLLAIMLVELLLCPFCKVEESFNLQAMHDILYLRTNFTQYDNLEFPGVVPRSFLGALTVSSLSFPISLAAYFSGFSKLTSQITVRFVLGLLILWPLSKIKKTLGKQLGKEVATWFSLITASQFHFLFYSTRPLPNTMALVLVLFAYNFWLSQKLCSFILTSAAAIIIFRGELSILLGLILLGELISKRLTISKTFKVGLVGGILSLALTVLVDSFFWRRFLWPEGEVLFFNVVLNKSSEWGTQPYFWYFYSALPRALGSSLFWIPIGLWFEKRTRPLIWPPIAFVFLYSFLPHKELRFIIYVFPLLNIAAAAACSRLWENRFKSRWNSLMALAAVGHLLLNAVLTTFLLTISYYNYPGGVALHRLHQLEPPTANVTVHIDNFAAQTGVSRFGQLNDNWIYDKTENLKAGGPELRSFTHLIVEAKSRFSHHLRPYKESHEILAVIEGFSHIHAGYNVFPPIRIRTKPCLFILKNKKPPTSPNFEFRKKSSEVNQDSQNSEKNLEESLPEDSDQNLDYDFEFANHFEGDSAEILRDSEVEETES